MTQMPDNSLSWQQWKEKLQKVSDFLARENSPAELEVIGSAALMPHSELRTSIDLDVWLPNSTFDPATLYQALDHAGLGHDDDGSFHGQTPYLQFINTLEAIPAHQPTQTEDFGLLKINRPDIEMIVAAKLAVFREKDIQDVIFLASNNLIDPEKLDHYISQIPEQHRREAAGENKVIADPSIYSQPNEKPTCPVQAYLQFLEDLKQQQESPENITAYVTSKLMVLAKETSSKPAEILKLSPASHQYLTGETNATQLLKSISQIIPTLPTQEPDNR